MASHSLMNGYKIVVETEKKKIGNWVEKGREKELRHLHEISL